MDLPDCPPGAEGYQDSVTEIPRKPEDPTCTKAELEFQEHLNSLKIRLEDGSARPMVERCGRDVSHKWIYLCYPCAAQCSGESILQTHLSGKKHKSKLAMTNAWPLSIFKDHPFHQQNLKSAATEKANQKVAEEIEILDPNMSEQDRRFAKYKAVRCHLQEALDEVKAPLVGLEYLIEHPPEQEHYEPKYICTLCFKQGQPRTIINHMTCFWHRYNYISRHYPKACNLLSPYRAQSKYREGVGIVISRLAQRIEDKYGRNRPVNIDKEDYDKDKDLIHQWIFKGDHFAEREDCTFEEVVDIGLIESLALQNNDNKEWVSKRKEPSPPVVAAPSKPHFNHFSRPAGRQERRGRAGSVESLSDISDDLDAELRNDAAKQQRQLSRDINDRRATSPFRSRFALRNTTNAKSTQDKTRAPNYDYKVKLAADKRAAAEEFARKTLAYHEKNPEKHPLYPEEWKKFWNKRYKEVQAEGKDPSKHDFKPEWIVFWTARMKVLHDEELRVTVHEIYRKMCLTPPDMGPIVGSEPPPDKRRRDDTRKDSAEFRRDTGDFRRDAADSRRRDPEPRRREPEPRRREPEPRRRDDGRRRSPERRRSPDVRHRSPLRRRSPDFRRDRRSPARRSPPRRSSERRRSPPQHRTRSRSPMRRHSPALSAHRATSSRRSRSPLSQRETQLRNRSPETRPLAPSMQTVLISDDELKPDDDISPWNSDTELGSVASVRTIDSRRRGGGGGGGGGGCVAVGATTAPDDVVATLRLLVALEDYLGSLGPKLIDLLAEALKMEKEKPNSSEELLVRESAVVLIETAKEKLKGATQAGLVAGSAAAAARAAVVRAAATLHEADKRAKSAQAAASNKTTKSAMPVAGVGEVDRAQIAQQMAEALIAQGKTDVSSEELAQLVDAVVGMAEAKKREAERRQPENRAPASQASTVAAQKPSGTTSALQMLQSAYDENEKKIEKEDAPDAMDGLSDSDLETLLKNFNELSAEEQHSLIAYLKKLEAREPTRVERLRQYVSDAAHASPPASLASAPVPASGPGSADAPGPLKDAPRRSEPAAVLIDSDDDDDYTVEEVFQSATQKVKEDQMRQEMEIVKKSLEEAKPESPSQPEVPPPAPVTTSNILGIHLSSASDLFALVQASLKSTPAPTPAPIVQPPEVVVSNTQPRSFGDLPEPTMVAQEAPKTATPTPLLSTLPPVNNQPPPPLLRTPLTDNGNRQHSPGFNQGSHPPNERFNQSNPPGNDRFNQNNTPPNDRFNQGNQPSSDRFNQANPPPNDRFNQGNQPLNEQFNQANPSPVQRFNQGNQLSNDRFNQGNQSPNHHFNQGNQPSNDRFNQPQNDRFNQGTQPPKDNFNQGNQPQNDRFNQGNQPPKDNFNQGNQPVNDRFNPNNQPPSDRFNQGNQPGNDRFNQGNLPPNERFSQGSQPPNDRFNNGNQPLHDRFNQGNQPTNDRFNFNNQTSHNQYNQGSQWNTRQNNIPLGGQPRPLLGTPDNFAPGGYNQSPRPNYMNPRGPDNYGNMNQPQFGNYDNQNNFRGRGRGHYGGPMRGRGRGYY